MSFWSANSRAFSNFPTIYLSSLTMKCFMSLILNESKVTARFLVKCAKYSTSECRLHHFCLYFRLWMDIFYQALFFKHNKLIYFIRGENTKKILINAFIIYFFKYFFSLKIRYTPWHILLVKPFTNQFNPSIYKMIVHTCIHHRFNFLLVILFSIFL